MWNDLSLLSDLLPWYTFFTFLAFLWGACIGSFLNVCIYRIPLEKSVVTPRSFCPHCQKPIPWYYNIPLVSFLLLRGKCGFCGGKISVRYFLVELLVALFFTLIWLKFDLIEGSRILGLAPITDWKLVPVYWLVIAGLTLGTFVDFEHMWIPDRVTLGGIAAGLILSALIPSLHGASIRWVSILWSIVGMSVGWGILWAIAILGSLAFKKDAMGFGDVKLMGAIGAFLGWKAVIFTLIMSSLFGSIVGLSLVLIGRRQMQSRIPYGPYIALAAIMWILWGPTWWQAYMDLMIPEIPDYGPL